MQLNIGVQKNDMGLEHQCIWQISVIYENETKTIAYPLTCEFNIEKSQYASATHATFNIYNLSPALRQSEFFRQDFMLDAGKIKVIEFSAGYNNLITCFRGMIREAYSTRRGTETITTIQAVGLDNQSLNTISVTFKKDTTFNEAYNNIASQLPLCKKFAKGILEGTFKKDTTFTGTPLQILNQITGGHTFVDNGNIITLNDNEMLEYPVLNLSSNGGLLEMPLVRSNQIQAKLIFNPSLVVCQRAELKTNSLSTYNGIYKIYGINHNGIISGTVSGQRVTTVNMIYKDRLPDSNVNTTAQTEKQGAKLVKEEQVYSDNRIADNVYRYIRSHNGAVPPWNINPLISWQDMIGQHGADGNTDAQRYAQLTPEILANCAVIADMLHRFLASSPLKGQAIQIVSGWRSNEANAKAKGSAKESAHLRGSAIDFKFIKYNTENAYNNVFAPEIGGWQYFTYPYISGATRNYYIHVQSSLGQNGRNRTGLRIN